MAVTTLKGPKIGANRLVYVYYVKGRLWVGVGLGASAGDSQRGLLEKEGARLQGTGGREKARSLGEPGQPLAGREQRGEEAGPELKGPQVELSHFGKNCCSDLFLLPQTDSWPLFCSSANS